jgi:acyl dehydratase
VTASGAASWPDALLGAALAGRRVRARNLFRDAPNRIHDDAAARALGFAGGLVAGVTLYGYLTRLVVEAWGLAWLERGTASVRFVRPACDGDELILAGRVVARSANPSAGEILAELDASRGGAEVVAALAAGLAWGGPVIAPAVPDEPAPPEPRALRPATPDAPEGPGALRAAVLTLDAATLARAADELDDPLPVYRGPGAVAHPALLLHQANRALAESVRLGPWIHVASDVSHAGLARAGERLETRGRVVRVYERGGRDWIDLDVVVAADGGRPVAWIRHTAIYRMPAPAAGREDAHG